MSQIENDAGWAMVVELDKITFVSMGALPIGDEINFGSVPYWSDIVRQEMKEIIPID